MVNKVQHEVFANLCRVAQYNIHTKASHLGDNVSNGRQESHLKQNKVMKFA